MKRWTLLGVFLTLAIVASPVYALVTDSPTLNVREVKAYRNVAESGDLLVLWRYAMPEAEWATHGRDAALASLNQTTVFQERVPPALGESLGAFYLASGHTFAWNTAATVDLDSSPTIFTNTASDSLSVTFVQTSFLIATSTADQTILCDDVTDMLIAIEAEDLDDDIEDRDLVLSGAITDAGTSVATVAFAAFAQVLPDCFSVGLETPNGFSAGNPALRDSLEAQAEASSIWTSFTGTANAFGFANTAFFLTLVGLVASFGVGTLLVLYSGSAQFGTASGAVFALGWAVNAPHWLLQVMFALAVVLMIGAASYWLRNVPR